MEPASVLFMDETSHGYTFLNVGTLQELEDAGHVCAFQRLITGRILKSPSQLIIINKEDGMSLRPRTPPLPGQESQVQVRHVCARAPLLI